MRKRIISELKAQGHTIAGEAKSGSEAVEMYRALKPDLVTMDITMRDMDGISAAPKRYSVKTLTPESYSSPFSKKRNTRKKQRNWERSAFSTKRIQCPS